MSVIGKKIYRALYAVTSPTVRLVRNAFSVLSLLFRARRRDQPLVIFSARDFNHGRYAFQLLNYFTLAGYQVCVYDSLPFLLSLSDYDALLFRSGNLIRFRKKYLEETADTERVFLNVNRKDPFAGLPGKHFHVDFDVFSAEQKENFIFLPYYVHPLMQHQLQQVKQVPLKKTGGVLFYGSDDLLHDAYWLKDYFKKLARSEISEILHRADLPLVYPKTFAELIRFLDEGCTDKVVYINNSLFRIPPHRWLEVLGRFQFFIASPGYCMPMCHNLIESFAMNTIPILQHPEHFHPLLEDNRNCIVFRDAEQLVERTREAVFMDPARRSLLQANVRDYYETHIDPSGFRKKMDVVDNGEYVLKFNAEEISLQEVKKKKTHRLLLTS